MSKIIEVANCYHCPNKAERQDWCSLVSGNITQGSIQLD